MKNFERYSRLLKKRRQMRFSMRRTTNDKWKENGYAREYEQKLRQKIEAERVAERIWDEFLDAMDKEKNGQTAYNS